MGFDFIKYRETKGYSSDFFVVGIRE